MLYLPGCYNLVSIPYADDTNLSFQAGLLSLGKLGSFVPRGLSSLNETKHSEESCFHFLLYLQLPHNGRPNICYVFIAFLTHTSTSLSNILLLALAYLLKKIKPFYNYSDYTQRLELYYLPSVTDLRNSKLLLHSHFPSCSLLFLLTSEIGLNISCSSLTLISTELPFVVLIFIL